MTESNLHPQVWDRLLLSVTDGGYVDVCGEKLPSRSGWDYGNRHVTNLAETGRNTHLAQDRSTWSDDRMPHNEYGIIFANSSMTSTSSAWCSFAFSTPRNVCVIVNAGSSSMTHLFQGL